MDTKQVKCPLCGDHVDRLIYQFHIDSEKEVIDRIRKKHTNWEEKSGACSRCVDYYHTEVVMRHQILPEAGPQFPIKSADDFLILPTPLRLNTDPHLTGNGITICMIDSGFYLHNDLVKTRNRVKAVVDITDLKQKIDYFLKPHPESWHGTMTTVVCAGDGYSSKGLYKGIASEADLVLLKVQTTTEGDPHKGRITTDSIVSALKWVLEHHKKYQIRVVNMSVSDDQPLSDSQSEVSSMVEKLFEEGVVVVAAAGNTVGDSLKPPASSAHAITVGGFDDSNTLVESDWRLYHSTYGETLDGWMKPELIAQAIWVAAPILPGTAEKKEAEWLHLLLGMNESELAKCLSTQKQLIEKETALDLSYEHANNLLTFRQHIIDRIQQTKFFSDNYMHADGTSFASPILTSIAAQLLQSEPDLRPPDVRNILFKTAKRLSNFDATRQGFGVVQPRSAIVQAMRRKKIKWPTSSPVVKSRESRIHFFIQNDIARKISLTGDFNGWATDVLLFTPYKDGIWEIEIPMLTTGYYHYKFVVDKDTWIEDVLNPYRTPDNYSGFNSILKID